MIKQILRWVLAPFLTIFIILWWVILAFLFFVFDIITWLYTDAEFLETVKYVTDTSIEGIKALWKVHPKE